MYTYYPTVIWRIDIILFFATLLATIFVIIYSALKEAYGRRYAREFIFIKDNLYMLIESSKEKFTKTCPAFIEKITPAQLLEIIRDAHQTLPEERLQKLKECFTASGKIAQIEKVAENSMRKWRKIYAIIGLGYLQSPHALEIMEKSVLDKDRDISYFSLLALGQIKNNASAKILLSVLEKRIVGGNRIVSLLATFPAAILPDVVSATYHKDPLVRFWALKLLARLNAVQYRVRIEELTQDDSVEVRIASCDCLGELAEKESKDSLMRCLKDVSWRVKAHAIAALSRIVGPRGLPAIIDLIKEDIWLARDSLKNAMIDDIEPFFPYIEQILCSNALALKKDCIEALEESGYLARLLDDVVALNTQVSARAVSLLKGVVASGSHSGLESALFNFSEDKRNRILRILRTIDKPLADHIAIAILNERLKKGSHDAY